MIELLGLGALGLATLSGSEPAREIPKQKRDVVMVLFFYDSENEIFSFGLWKLTPAIVDSIIAKVLLAQDIRARSRQTRGLVGMTYHYGNMQFMNQEGPHQARIDAVSTEQNDLLKWPFSSLPEAAQQLLVGSHWIQYMWMTGQLEEQIGEHVAEHINIHINVADNPDDAMIQFKSSNTGSSCDITIRGLRRLRAILGP